ncbi:hypothetical protein HDU97_006155 [Phlyctochytrium planicorne]|nr:hypothetical protein HDU97_006155 [Phlyctochytrium planicorne]
MDALPQVTLGTWGIFLLFGITSLIAWNTWITAGAHYSLAFKGTVFESKFPAYCAVSYMVTNLLSLCTLMFAGHMLRPRLRIKIGLFMNASIFILAAILTTVVSKFSPFSYFVATLMLVVLSAMGAALVTGVFAFASEYSPICTQAVSTGQGFAGLVPAATVWLLLLSGSTSNLTPEENDASAAQSFIFSQIPSESEAMDTERSEAALPEESQEVDQGAPQTPLSGTNVKLLRRIIFYCLATFVTFVVTLGLYPAILTDVGPLSNSFSDRGKQIFTASMFVLFNCADVIGKALPGYSFLRIKSGKRLFYVSLARFLLIPLFFMCNAKFLEGRPIRQVLPLVFGNGAFFVLVALLAMSGGWLATNVFIEVAKASPGEEFAATDAIVFILAIGLAAGAITSSILRQF